MRAVEESSASWQESVRPQRAESQLSVPSLAALESHPKLGASWEGFALEEVLRVTGDRDAYFWHTQGGAALDLLVFLNGERFGFEFKYADVPTVTRSLQVAERRIGSCRRDLLDHALVLHEAHLRRLVKDYISYYRTDRTHDGLEKDTPAARPVAPKPTESARLLPFPRVGGLHHRYDWQQAD